MPSETRIPSDTLMNSTSTPSSVISSDRVAGTDVFNPAGDSLGSIDHLVIDKRSGIVRLSRPPE